MKFERVDILLNIKFENEDFLVIDKPFGISFNNEHDSCGVFTLLQNQTGSNTLFPVHRLDKITSGLLVIAKNQKTAAEFGKIFSDKKIQKYYLAISNKKPSKKQGLIKGDMERSRRGSWKLTKSNNNPAITQFFTYSIQSGLRLFLLKLHTGKTHQIRVALKSIGSPICGDPIYSSNSNEHERAYLHAYFLQFELFNKDYSFRSIPSSGELFLLDTTKQLIEDLKNPDQEKWPKINP